MLKYAFTQLNMRIKFFVFIILVILISLRLLVCYTELRHLGAKKRHNVISVSHQNFNDIYGLSCVNLISWLAFA